MALKFPCPLCSAPNRYEEYECGAEKYCISCQRLITVPAGDAAASAPSIIAPAAAVEATAPVAVIAATSPVQPTAARAAPAAVAATQRRRDSARVFGVLDTDSLIQGKVLCPCDPDNPVEIPYRISDIAVGHVYCPRCSRAVSIGETLDRARDLSPALPGVEVAAPQLKPGAWRRTVPGILGVVLVLAAVVAGAAWMWRDAPLVSSVLYDLGLRDEPLIGSGPPPKVVIIPLKETELARLGLMLAATETAGPLPALLAVHPKLFSKAAAAPEIRITPETIEALLKEPDAQSALITAQVWKQVLGDQQAAATDPRYAALDRVIRQLEDRLHPRSDPSVVVRFRELLGKIRGALSEAQDNEKRLTDAAGAIQETGALLEKHPQDLAVLARVFYDLKRSYDMLEREKNGIRRIDKHLDQAEEFARKEAGVSALEEETRAKFLARRTPMDKPVGERLEARVRKLEPELQFARGKQAVVELRQCLADGDAAARDRLAGEARTHLSHLPGSKVGALLQEVLKAEGAAPRGAPDSPFSKAVAFRILYEKALEGYAVDDGAKLLKHAAEAASFASGEAQQKLANLVFDFLDQVAGDTLPLSERAPELPERFGNLRQLLDQATTWKAEPRWRKLDDPLRKRGEQVAQTALESAKKFAHQEQFDKARQEVKPAILLGERATKKQAEDLDRTWEQELKDRADRATQEQHWQRVMKFHVEKKALDAWSELCRFTKGYPKSARQKEAKDLDAELRPQVTALVAAKIREMDGYGAKKSWREFQQGYALLKPLPLTGAEAAKVEQYGKQIDANHREVDGKFHLLAGRNQKMTTQYEVKALLVELPRILAISPGHAEAAALYDDAKQQGKIWAQKLLERVANLPPTSKLAQDLVGEIAILDASGSIAAEARALLARKKK